MIADGGAYQAHKNKYFQQTKFSKPFSATKFVDETQENYIDTLSYLTRAAYGTKHFKPCVEVLEILRNAQKDFVQGDTFYVLPEIGDYGVVLNPKKGNADLLETRYEILSELDAKAIENFMFETASSLDKETSKIVKNQIAYIFDSAKNIGNQRIHYNKNNHYRCVAHK